MADAYSAYTSEKQYISDLIDNPAESDDAEKAEILYEVTEKRDEHTKVYKRADGTYTALVSQTPLHFMSDGVWKEIDNTLISKNGELTNADNPFNVTLPERITSNSQITLENDGDEIAFAVNDITASSSKIVDAKADTVEEFEAAVANTKSEVKYEDVAEDTDIEYVILPNGIKENIIVSEAASIKDTYSFDIEIGNLSYRLNDNNSLDITDANGDVKFIIPAPVMTDSKLALSYDIGVNVTDNNNGTITLVYTPSNEWTGASERAYPITIDPAILNQQYSDNMFEDTIVCYDSSDSTKANTNYYDEGLVAICDYTENNTTYKSEVYTRVNTELLQGFGDGAVITDAQYIIGGIAAGSRLYAKALTSSVNMETVTYNTKPDTSNLSVIDYYTAPRALGVNANDTEFLHFNITKALNDWLNGATNYGMALVPDSNFLAVGYINGHSMNSSTSSVLVLDFVYVNGYNDLYNYHSQDIGRAGTGYVNDFTRSMSLIRNDLSIPGNIMPVSIDMVYNSALFDNFTMNSGESAPNICGNNWLPNYYRFVQYTDEMQIHYFTETGSEIDFLAQMGENDEISFVDSHAEYIGDSGYTAEILEAPENYEGDYLDLIQITRPDGYVERFNSYGELISITNPDYPNQHINIYYTAISGIDYIDYITDGVGRKYDFVYDSNTHLLSEIVCKSASNVTIKAGTTNSDLKVSYTYDNNGNLTAVTFADGKTVYYTYDSNGLLTSAQNIDSYKIVYTYGTDKKVSNVTEYAFDGTNFVAGNYITYTEIAATQISLSDNNNMTETYFFDSLGQIKYTYGSDGNYYFNSGNSNNDTFFVNSCDYKPLTENFLASPSFETSNGWSGTGYSVITDSSARTGEKVAKLSANNNNSTKYISQTINIAQSGNYTVSAYIKKLAEVENGDGAFKINIKGYNASNSKKYDIDETVDCLTTDWQRFKATIDNSGHNYPLTKIVITISSTSSNTDIIIDDVQLENSLSATDFNLVEDGSFNLTDTGNFWSVSGNYSIVTDSINGKSVKALKFNGGVNTSNTALKQISIDGKKDDVFSVGGWFKGDFVRSEPNSKIMSLFTLMEAEKFNFTDDRYAQLEVSYQYEEEIEGETTETCTETIVVPYLQCLSEWQFAADSFALKGDTDTLYLTIRYNKNANPGMFTGIELTYDKDAIVFDEAEEPETSSCPCEDCEEPNCPCICANEENCTCVWCQRRCGETTIDTFGNITSTTAFDGVKAMVTQQSYSTDGNYLTSETDELGNTTSYTVNTLNGIINAITDPNTNTTNYAFDAYNLLTTVYTLDSQNTVESEVQYTYTNDRLTAITHNGFTYNITYDIWGQMTEFAVGSQPIITYFYGITNHRDRLTHVIYHHATSSSITNIDDNGVVIGNLVNAGDVVFEYHYNDNGTVFEIVQYQLENSVVVPTVKYEFEYDSLGNNIRTTETNIRIVEMLDGQTTIKTYDGLTTVYRSYYNENNHLEEVIGNITYESQSFDESYDYITGSTVSKTDVKFSNGSCVGVLDTTDYFGRLSEKIIKTESAVDSNENNNYAAIGTNYSYSNDDNNTVHTSNRIKQYSNRIYFGTGVSSSTEVDLLDGYEYVYDANGNVIEEYSVTTAGVSSTPIRSFEYDNLNQLVRVNDKTTYPLYTYVYNYDDSGNIISKIQYPYSDGTLSSPIKTIYYNYDSVWKDKLSDFGTGNNNTEITYDNIGNPLTIGNKSFSWNGREMKTYDGVNRRMQNIHVEYEYDEHGLRHHKAVYTNSVLSDSYDYVWLESRLISQTHTNYSNGIATSSNTAKFIYDSSGSLLGFIYNDEHTYLFTKNLYGDITSIVNENGEIIIRYFYDVWGTMSLSVDNYEYAVLAAELSKVSSFTYRGYCYDDDSELYYLQSRYYSPAIGRFINSDDPQVALLSYGNILGANIFMYCSNNPVLNTDETGAFSVSSVVNALKNLLNKFKEAAVNYFKTLITFENGKLNISTSLISRLLNTVVRVIIASKIVNAASDLLGKVAESYLVNHYSVLKNLVDKLISVMQSSTGRAILRLIVGKVIAKKFSLSDGVIGNIVNQMISNELQTASQVANKIFIVASSFSSVGGVLALLFFDMVDKNIDGYFSIRINARNRIIKL